MNVYPIYLNRLSEKKTILIGGNNEAERKVRELLECNANITVISPGLTDELEKLAYENKIEWTGRSYLEGDLRGAFLVIVAESNEVESQLIYDEAEKLGILVNVMDDIPHCNFTFGTVVRRGPLILTVSTSGAAPVLAVRLKERFEREFGDEYEQFLNFSRALRKPMARAFPSFQDRKRLWYKLVDSDIIELFRAHEDEQAYKKAAEIVGAEVVEEALNSNQ